MNCKKIKVTKEVFDQIKENMERGSWIPWNEFLELKVNDTIKIPIYNSKDMLIGYEKVKIHRIEIQHPEWEDWGGATIGHISGWYAEEYFDKTNVEEEGGMSGVISVKTEEIEGFNKPKEQYCDITIREMYEKAGGKERYWELYKSLEDKLFDWLKENKLEIGAENTYEIMEMLTNHLVEDIRESWYRQSLAKTYYH